jgi:hypothetical protein
MTTSPLINGINELFSELVVHTRGGTVLFVDEAQSECMSWNASLETLMNKGAVTVMDLHQSSSWISSDTLSYLFELKRHQKRLRIKKTKSKSIEKKKENHKPVDDDEFDKIFDDDEEEEEFDKMFSDEEEEEQSVSEEYSFESDSDEELAESGLFAPIKALFFVGMLSPRNERAIKKAVHTYGFEHIVVLCSHSDSFSQLYQRTCNEHFLTFSDLREKATLWAKEAQMIKLREKFNEADFEP